MRFELFRQMTPSEAQDVLQQFVQEGAANMDFVCAHAKAAGVICDYSLEYLPSFLEWAFSQMRTVPREADPKVPEWIRSTEDYQKGLFDFEDESKDLICYAAYYFGESFVRNCSHLRWATGKFESRNGYISAESNMPVVTGFKNRVELAPMMVLENVFSRITANPNRSDDIQTMIDGWRKYL